MPQKMKFVEDDYQNYCPDLKKKWDGETKKLVHLSKTVFELIRNSRITTVGDVASEINRSYLEQKRKIEMKNIQRRVYDALNVLSALQFIKKSQGKIVWKGFLIH